MFVGDEDGREVLGSTADSGKAQADLTQAKSRVNEDAGFVGLHVGAIAGGTAPEDGQADRHGSRYGGARVGAIL